MDPRGKVLTLCLYSLNMLVLGKGAVFGAFASDNETYSQPREWMPSSRKSARVVSLELNVNVKTD
jgi:hypothetical protein